MWDLSFSAFGAELLTLQYCLIPVLSCYLLKDVLKELGE